MRSVPCPSFSCWRAHSVYGRMQTRNAFLSTQDGFPGGAPEGRRLTLTLATLSNQNTKPGLGYHRLVDEIGLLLTYVHATSTTARIYLHVNETALNHLACDGRCESTSHRTVDGWRARPQQHGIYVKLLDDRLQHAVVVETLSACLRR